MIMINTPNRTQNTDSTRDGPSRDQEMDSGSSDEEVDNQRQPQAARPALRLEGPDGIVVKLREGIVPDPVWEAYAIKATQEVVKDIELERELAELKNPEEKFAQALQKKFEANTEEHGESGSKVLVIVGKNYVVKGVLPVGSRIVLDVSPYVVSIFTFK